MAFARKANRCDRYADVVRPQPSDLYARPDELVGDAVAAYGIHTVIDTCLALIEGHEDYDLLAMPLTYLGGVAALRQLDRGDLSVRGQAHWPRTWGVRGLMHAWMPYASSGVVTALDDPHWRVRESAAKVADRHAIAEADEALLPMLTDADSRVRVAAMRAVAHLGDDRHLAVLNTVASDDRAVQVARNAAVRSLRRRVSTSRA